MSKKRFSLLIIVIIISLDQLTKIFMINKQITIIPKFLSLSYVENAGAAFGMGSNGLWLIVLISIILIAVLIKILLYSNVNTYTLISLEVVIAGGISNLIDRMIRGYVIDFIDINIFKFPNFNIADISITIGIIGLIIASFNLIRKGD